MALIALLIFILSSTLSLIIRTGHTALPGLGEHGLGGHVLGGIGLIFVSRQFC